MWSLYSWFYPKKMEVIQLTYNNSKYKIIKVLALPKISRASNWTDTSSCCEIAEESLPTIFLQTEIWNIYFKLMHIFQNAFW